MLLTLTLDTSVILRSAIIGRSTSQYTRDVYTDLHGFFGTRSVKTGTETHYQLGVYLNGSYVSLTSLDRTARDAWTAEVDQVLNSIVTSNP